MSVSLTTEETAVEQLQLSPATRQMLEAALSTFKELKFDADALTHLMDIERMTIGKILEEAGVDKTSAEDFSLCWVRGSTSSTLDKKKLLAQGITMAQIEAATVVKPKKPYFQIRSKTEKAVDTAE